MDSFLFDEGIIIPKIGKTAKLMTYHLGDSMINAGIDLSKEQFVVLKYLYHKNGMIQNDLAFITDRSKTALTRLLSTLEKKNYIYRESGESDKRNKYVYLSEAGRTAYEEALPVIQRLISELQSGIKKEELIITQRVLDIILENICKNYSNAR